MIELDRFLKLQTEMKTRFPTFRQHAECAFSVHEREGPGQTIDLWISAMVHGNEVLGLYLVNHLMETILSGEVACDFALAISLGNPEATLQGERFLQRDLNRSFGLPQLDSYEAKRAFELSEIARKSKVVIDLHQTVEPTETPFFIFPDSPQNVRFAINANQSLSGLGLWSVPLPLVTYPRRTSSSSGKTLMESLSEESVTVALELGQIGWHAEWLHLGFQFVVHSFSQAQSSQMNSSPPLPFSSDPRDFPIYQLTGKLENKPGLVLVPGLRNFSDLRSGDLIAMNGETEIRAEQNCKIFFPKYGELARKSPILVEMATLRSISQL